MKNKKNTKMKNGSSLYTELKKLGIDFEVVENPPDLVSNQIKKNGNDPNDMVVCRFFSINDQLTEEEMSFRLSTLLGSEIQQKLYSYFPNK